MTAPPLDAARAEAGAALRAELARVRAQLAVGLAAAPAGADAAAALADVYNGVARWRAAVADERAPLALVATGAWARRELAPYSDIDFIVVHAGAEAAARRVADRLLYPLWDAKVAVGHAVREPRECAKLAKDNLATATALCDLRPIVGDLGLTETLLAAARAAIAPAGDANRLIAALAGIRRAATRASATRCTGSSPTSSRASAGCAIWRWRCGRRARAGCSPSRRGRRLPTASRGWRRWATSARARPPR